MIFCVLMEIYAAFYEAIFEMTIKTQFYSIKKGTSNEKKLFNY